MNKSLIANWNSAVANSDVVYILGDMFWCKQEEAITALKELNGKKILIKGNHDRCNDGRFLKCFDKVVEYLQVKDNDKDIILCHYPIPYFKNHYYGYIHFYGHVHNTKEYQCVLRAQQDLVENGMMCDMYNVGCMMPYINYIPRTVNEIINDFQKKC